MFVLCLYGGLVPDFDFYLWSVKYCMFLGMGFCFALVGDGLVVISVS